MIATVSRRACFGGQVSLHRHDSVETRSPMRFSVFAPPQARRRPVPVLYYLPGLTCDDETLMIKGGAQRVAAELGLLLVASDTSPREPHLPGDDDSIEFGIAAGFYVDATQAPGWYDVTIEPRGMLGGVYFCRMTAGSFSSTRRMVVVR